MNPSKANDRVAAAVSLAGVGLGLYWMFTYSGPYRYLAELQLKWFGSYVPKLTVILIVLAFLGIAAIAKLVLRGAERPAPAMPQGYVGTSPASGVTGTPVGGGNSLLASPYMRLWFLVIPLGMGGYLYFNAAQAGELQQLQVQDFDEGRVTSRVLYADVRGHLSGKYMIKDNYMYIPMLDSATSGQAHVLIGVDKNKAKTYLQAQADGTFAVRGMAQRDLEAEVRVAFQKHQIPLAENCWVVRAGRDPMSDRKFALFLIALSAVLGAGLGGWLAYKNKQNVAPQPVRANP